MGPLDIARNEYDEMLAIKPNLAKHIHFSKDAWEKSTGKTIYHSKTNSLHEPFPDIYLKVPTGGGKTLLACHSIDLVQKSYLKKQTGLGNKKERSIRSGTFVRYTKLAHKNKPSKESAWLLLSLRLNKPVCTL